MWIHPKERSLNPRHVPGSQGESEDEAGSGAPGLTPCHGEHLIPVAGLSLKPTSSVSPALAGRFFTIVPPGYNSVNNLLFCVLHP